MTASIRPDYELAYLALVTSKDEEAEADEKDSAPPPLIVGSVTEPAVAPTEPDMPIEPVTSPVVPVLDAPVPSPFSDSVLGKRSSEDRDDAMDEDVEPLLPSLPPLPTVSASAPSDKDVSMDDGSDHSTSPSPNVSPILSPRISAHKVPRQGEGDQEASAPRSLRAMTIEPESLSIDMTQASYKELSPEQRASVAADAPSVSPRPPPLPPRPVPAAPARRPTTDGPMMFGECLAFWTKDDARVDVVLVSQASNTMCPNASTTASSRLRRP